MGFEEKQSRVYHFLIVLKEALMRFGWEEEQAINQLLG